MPSRFAKDFRSFADLAEAFTRDQDYRIVQQVRPGSSTVILAPHGGSIEAFTSDIARGIAGEEYGLYLFEGLLRAGNFASLHLPSERFDEPGCLQMLADCDRVVSVHGCSVAGEAVFIGGRDRALGEAVAASLRAEGSACQDAVEKLAGQDPRNICNRGRAGQGVQLEVSLELRRSPRRKFLVTAVRQALGG